MKKCINHAYSTFNLYVLYIKLAHNSKQFMRLVLENFITVNNFYLVERAFYGLRPWVFGLLNNPPPVCQQATSIQSVKYGNTYAGKSFCWHTGGGGGGNDVSKNVFGFLYILM